MLDNIIEKYGLDEVSKKTKVSKHNLEKLLKKEFSSFSKPRALGFISILEREYKEDLSAIKEEINEWFKNSSKDDKKQTDIAFPPLEEKKQSGHWIATVPIIVVFVFGFYLYRNEFTKSEVIQEKRVIVKNVQKVIDENRSDKLEKSHTIKELKSEKNSSVKLLVTQSKDTQKVISIDKNISEVKDIESKETAKKLDENKTIISSSSNSSIAPYVPAENIVIYPNRKMWIGIVNLKNKKRGSRMISKTFAIEPDVKRLLITGHGFFSISDTDGNNLKFNGSKKHYFLLKKGVVKEIDLKEFKRLNGGRVW